MFDLHAIVVRSLDESSDPDPGAAVAAVMASIPSRHLRDALAQALPSYVTNVATLARGRALRSDSVLPTPSTATGSARWAAAAAVLSQRIFTGDAWKHLRDCTADDLMGAAETRRARAQTLLANADQLEALAKIVADHGASTVGDLDEDQIREVLAA